MSLTAEVSSFFAVTPQTSIEISHGEDSDFRVNFNLTFPEVSCEWLSVDIFDVIGHKKTNITDNTIHKYSMTGGYVAPAIKSWHEPVIGGSTDAVVYSEKRFTIPLTTINFNRVVHEYKAMVVAFIAPWCMHCQVLKPIFEHAAEMVQTAMTGRNSQGRWQRDLALATVDCTLDVNSDLCSDQHIQAFPTIRVFRRGSDRSKGLHESYRGDRTAEKISEFALAVLAEVETSKGRGEGTDADGDGRLDSYVHTLGCRVEGFLRVSRVPGSVTFSPHAVGHDFHVENINMSHVVNALSFGKPLVDGSSGAIPARYRSKVPTDLGGAYASGRTDKSTFFTSLRGKITYEHFLKVVPTAYQALRGAAVEAYEYTINSNEYEDPDEEAVPHVRFTYDLSPMQVVVRETSRPIIDGIVGLLAIMGGVYTAFSMVEGTLQASLRAMRKQREGKLG